jgi:hypothetical protein
MKGVLLRVWRDPVWSKVIAWGIIACISLLILKIRNGVSSALFVSKGTIVVIAAAIIAFSVGAILWVIVRQLSRRRSQDVASQEQLSAPPSSKIPAPQEQRSSPVTVDIPIPGHIPRERLPQVQAADSIDDLRRQAGVRPLTSEENELSLGELPDGVFGFVEAYKLNSPQLQGGWRILDTSNIEQNFLLNKYLLVYQNPPYTEKIEIHKCKDSGIYLVCHTTEEDRIALQNPSRSQSIRITVSLESTPKRNKVVAIPRERLLYWRLRTLGDGEQVSDAMIS